MRRYHPHPTIEGWRYHPILVVKCTVNVCTLVPERGEVMVVSIVIDVMVVMVVGGGDS